MATLLVLSLSWAAIGILWLVVRLAEARECRSVDAYQASRTALSSVAERACPDPPVRRRSPEAHVRLVEDKPLALAAVGADARPSTTDRRTRRRRATTRHPGPGRPTSAPAPVRLAAAPAGPFGGPDEAARQASGSAVRAPAGAAAAAPATGDAAPRPVLRFGDGELEPPSLGGPVAADHPASRGRRRRRLAGQVGALGAVGVAAALLAPPAAAVLGVGDPIPAGEVEVLPAETAPAALPPLPAADAARAGTALALPRTWGRILPARWGLVPLVTPDPWTAGADLQGPGLLELPSDGTATWSPRS